MKKITSLTILFLVLVSCNIDKTNSLFSHYNNRLKEVYIGLESKNIDLYSHLKILANNDSLTYYKDLVVATKIKNASDLIFENIKFLKEQIKGEVLEESKSLKIGETTFLDSYFFKGNGLSDQGSLFLNHLTAYKDSLNAILPDDTNVKNILNSRFDLSDISNLNNEVKPWLVYNFKGISSTVANANFTLMEYDIIKIFNSYLVDVISKNITKNPYQAKVIIGKSTFTQGEKVEGTVIYGNFQDYSLPDEVLVNGIKLDKERLKKGIIKVDIPTDNIGIQNLDGIITFDDEKVPNQLQFTLNYKVVPKPKLSETIDLITTSKSKSSTTKKSESKGLSKDEVLKIIASKEPLGTIKGLFGKVSLNVSTLIKSRVGAIYIKNKLRLRAVEFYLKVPGQASLIVKGDRFNTRAINLLRKSKKGQVISILNIKSKIDDFPTLRIKKATPVYITIK